MARARSQEIDDIAGSLLPASSRSRTVRGFSGDDEADEIVRGRQHDRTLKNREDDRYDFAEDDDEDSFIAAQRAAAPRTSSLSKTKPNKKSGGFQSMGMGATLLRAITKKGFSVPTPIQRKTIPAILDGQDVVGMARTGSGKTAAFVVPMIEKLKTHSAKVGARAIVLAPSRELALQTLKSTKELGRGTDLRAVLLVGGDSMEEQFTQMTSNPDIIVATPGRFLHLMVEMSLDLSSVRYAVFDEADRLFEMGFATQLTEILHALPQTRQTLLFSATLPKSLVEFAKAGLKDPRLIRLDTETKISPDLQSTFLTIKSADKEGALLHILSDVIKVPLGQLSDEKETANPKKRKRGSHTTGHMDVPTEQSTVIFAATKHHVEYLASLLSYAGFAVAYNYGSLDQTARKSQVENFRNGSCSVLVVTDVAARGIDIPLLANVINYDFPSQPKIFLHRVGRTARAGRTGWSYNLVQVADLPYLVDLQAFLGRSLVERSESFRSSSFAEDIVVGRIPAPKLEPHCEWVGKLLIDHEDLDAQHTVASKGQKLYNRSRNAASAECARKANRMQAEQSLQDINPIYRDTPDVIADGRESMLRRISGFRPSETVFEIGRRGDTTETGEVVRKQRNRLRSKKTRQASANDTQDEQLSIREEPDSGHRSSEDGASSSIEHDDGMKLAEDQDGTFSMAPANSRGSHSGTWRDEENFMSYEPRDMNLIEDSGYGVRSGSGHSAKNANFIAAARGAAMDLTKDESVGFFEATRPSQMRWDKKSKKYVKLANDEDGSKGRKLVRSESGQKIAASFRSGRFDAWQKSNRVKKQRTGEQEDPRQARPPKAMGKFKHHADKAPKRPDKYRDDFHKQKKRVAGATPKPPTPSARHGKKGTLRSEDDIRKARELKERRRDKNARPTRKRKV